VFKNTCVGSTLVLGICDAPASISKVTWSPYPGLEMIEFLVDFRKKLCKFCVTLFVIFRTFHLFVGLLHFVLVTGHET
jgi:hypothetical protein